MNIINFLKKTSKISIDTANIDYIKKFEFDSVTSNPTLILNAFLDNSYNNLLINFFKKNKKKIILDSNYKISFYDELIIYIIGNLISYVKDKISVEIPARISYNFNLIIIYSKKIIFLCDKFGIDKNRILIKIPATDEGIKAASKLKNLNINCNLTLIFNINQVKKCFDEGIYLISPFVGRISDNINCYNDSGINFVKNIYSYKILNNYKTKIMAASFRNINQIINVNFCDYITISPNYFEYMRKNSIYIKNNYKIFHVKNNFKNIPLIIANNLLLNGIKQFDVDHIRLIKLISSIINNL